jgi:drug/metabolite transporter (DMT)-like permease
MSPPPVASDPAPAAVLRAPAGLAALPADSTLAGIGLIVASTIFFSAGDITAKMMTETLPPVEVTWIRYAVFLAAMWPAAAAVKGWSALRSARPGLQIVRGLAVVVSSVLFILGLAHLPVAETTAINFMSPAFVTALSIPLLGERVGIRRWLAAAAGFLGVMIIVQPGSDAFQPAALFPLAAATVWAGAAIATRMMSREAPETTLAWSAGVGFVVLSLLVPFSWQTPTATEVGLGILTGLGSTAGHWLLVQAYRRAPASVLAPFSYVQLVFAAAFSFLAFGAVPGPSTFLGGAVIVASGLYTAHRERVRAREGHLATRALPR